MTFPYCLIKNKERLSGKLILLRKLQLKHLGSRIEAAITTPEIYQKISALPKKRLSLVNPEPKFDWTVWRDSRESGTPWLVYPLYNGNARKGIVAGKPNPTKFAWTVWRDSRESGTPWLVDPLYYGNARQWMFAGKPNPTKFAWKTYFATETSALPLQSRNYPVLTFNQSVLRIRIHPVKKQDPVLTIKKEKNRSGNFGAHVLISHIQFKTLTS